MTKIDELVFSGKSFLENGDFNKSLEFFEQALLIDPKNPDLWNYKGTEALAAAWRLQLSPNSNGCS